MPSSPDPSDMTSPPSDVPPLPTTPTAGSRDAPAPVMVGLSGWFGPLPPPDALAAYDRAHPGLGGTLVKQMVDESAHRRGYMDRTLTADIDEARDDRRERRLGQHYALVVGLVAILSGTTAACLNHDVTGGLIGGGGVVGLVAVFIQGRASPGRDRYAGLASHDSGRPR